MNNKSNLALAIMFLFVALAINTDNIVLGRLHIAISLIMAALAFHALSHSKNTEHE
jgi:disulfide bond formation protein DsbB